MDPTTAALEKEHEAVSTTCEFLMLGICYAPTFFILVKSLNPFLFW